VAGGILVALELCSYLVHAPGGENKIYQENETASDDSMSTRSSGCNSASQAAGTKIAASFLCTLETRSEVDPEHCHRTAQHGTEAAEDVTL